MRRRRLRGQSGGVWNDWLLYTVRTFTTRKCLMDLQIIHAEPVCRPLQVFNTRQTGERVVPKILVGYS